MGQVIQEEGNLDESVIWYRRSLELDPNAVLVQCNLATALKEQNKHHEAIAHYDMALRLDPNSADAHNGRGWVRHEQGDLEEALYHYRKAIQFRSDFALGALQPGHRPRGIRRHGRRTRAASAMRCVTIRTTPKPVPC